MKKLILCSAVILLSAANASAGPEVYIGSTLGGQDLNYGPTLPSSPNHRNMDAGIALGAGWQFGTPVSGLTVGPDLMWTRQDYGPVNADLESLSLMLHGRYSYNLSPALSVYGGLGAGFIRLEYEEPSSSFLNGDDTITGFQAEMGAAYQLSNFTVFSAIKYQEGFDEGSIQTESVEYNSTSAIIGLRF